MPLFGEIDLKENPTRRGWPLPTDRKLFRDVKAVYDLIKDVFQGDTVIPLNKRNTKNSDKLSVGSFLCDAGLTVHRNQNSQNKR